MNYKFAILAVALVAGAADAKIQFKKGWDSKDNSDVQTYTQKEVTDILTNQSDDLKAIINGPAACVLEVTKGCHDKRPGKSHFTINGTKSTDKCKVKSIYVGSKSDHEPSCKKK